MAVFADIGEVMRRFPLPPPSLLLMKGCHTFISEDFFPKIYIRENCMIYIWNHFYFFKIYAGWENYLIKIYRNVPPGKYECFNRHLSIATENVLSLTYSSRCETTLKINCTFTTMKTLMGILVHRVFSIPWFLLQL